jgi:hypothetical protein
LEFPFHAFSFWIYTMLEYKLLCLLIISFF